MHRELNRIAPREDPFKIKSLYADSFIHGARVHTTLLHLVASGGSQYKIEDLKCPQVFAEFRLEFPLPTHGDVWPRGKEHPAAGGSSVTAQQRLVRHHLGIFHRAIEERFRCGDKINFHTKTKYAGELTLTYPQLNITSHYYKRGTKISYGNFQTHGQLKGSFKNITAAFKFVASPITKYGVDYLKLESVSAKVFIEHGHLELKPHDKSIIGRKIAMFAHMNPNWALQMETPAIEDVSARLFQQYVNEALLTMPLKDILVD